MHFGYNIMKANYFMDEVNLEHVTEEKDIGVINSEDLRWEKQCSSALSKANIILGMMRFCYCIKVWKDHTRNIAAKYGVLSTVRT